MYTETSRPALSRFSRRRLPGSTLSICLCWYLSRRSMGFVGLMGAFVNVYRNEQTSFVSFFQEAFTRINFVDLFVLVFKSAVYGFTIGMTGCFNGYYASQGTVGVGRAANASVVVSMFLIFIEEMVM